MSDIIAARKAILNAHAAIVTARSARKRALMLKHSGVALDLLNTAFGALQVPVEILDRHSMLAAIKRDADRVGGGSPLP